MEWNSPWFVIAIIAISTFGWIATSWIRARHGYPITDDWGNTVLPRPSAGEDEAAALAAENEALKTQLGTLEQRLRVLERIATDPAERTAREIEKLR